MAKNEDEDVENLPPSVKLIIKTLQHEAPLTQKKLAQSTLLPTRTVRYAINRLEDVDAIISEPLPADGRQKLYDLSIEAQSEETETSTPASDSASKQPDDTTVIEPTGTRDIGDQDVLQEIQSEFKEIDT